jgi:hypothetical protein
MKKRGKIRAVILFSFGLVVAVLFIAVFFGGKKEEITKYELSASELTEFQKIVDAKLAFLYPECVAFATKDILLCNNASDESDKEECLFFLSLILAKQDQNPVFCDNIKIEDKKNICIKYANNELQCDNLGSVEKQYCYAIKDKDLTKCDVLNAEERLSCKAEVNLIIAVLTKDNQKCQEISTEWIKDYCIAYTASDIKVCDKNAYDKDEIMKSFALAKQNYTFCLAIEKTKQRELCLLEFASSSFEVCEKIYTKDMKNACEAIKARDIAKCNNINDEIAKIVCKGNAY